MRIKDILIIPQHNAVNIFLKVNVPTFQKFQLDQERQEVEERLVNPRTTSSVALPPLIHSELQVQASIFS